MYWSPAAISLSAPLVGEGIRGLKALGSHLSGAVQAGGSFANQLSATTSESIQSGTSSVSEQLSALGKQVRQWASENGIQGPFELSIHGSDSGALTLDAHGADRDSIMSLLSSDPQFVEKLKEQLAAIQATASSITPLLPVVRVTEQSEELSYVA